MNNEGISSVVCNAKFHSNYFESIHILEHDKIVSTVKERDKTTKLHTLQSDDYHSLDYLKGNTKKIDRKGIEKQQI